MPLDPHADAGTSPGPRSLEWLYRTVFIAGLFALLVLFGTGGARVLREAVPPTRGLDAFAQGNALENGGDLKGAAREYRAAAAVAPSDIRAFISLARVLEASGDREGALAARQATLVHHPLNAAAHRDLGLTLLSRRALPEASAHLAAAVRLDPRDALAQAAAGDVRRELGDTAGAIEAYQRALELQPRDAAVHNKLGIALALSGNSRAARAQFIEAIRLDPASPAAENLRRLSPGGA